MHTPRILASRKRKLKMIDATSEPNRSNGTIMKVPSDDQNPKELLVYVCSICKSTVTSSKAIIYHMIYSHTSDKKVQRLLHRISSGVINPPRTQPAKVRKFNTRYECAECKYTTVHQTSFHRHVMTHQKGTSLYKCPHCTFATIQQYNLKRHMESQHPQLVKSPLIIA